MLEVIALVLFSGLFDLTGQIFYKKSLNVIKTRRYLDFMKTALSSPKIWLGFSCMGISIIVWLIALEQTELSIAYSLYSMEYILTLIGARIFLSEKIDGNKLAGTLLVVLGIVLVVRN